MPSMPAEVDIAYISVAAPTAKPTTPAKYSLFALPVLSLYDCITELMMAKTRNATRSHPTSPNVPRTNALVASTPKRITSMMRNANSLNIVPRFYLHP